MQLQTLALGAVFHCNLTVVTTYLRLRLLIPRMPTCIYRGKGTQKKRESQYPVMHTTALI